MGRRPIAWQQQQADQDQDQDQGTRMVRSTAKRSRPSTGPVPSLPGVLQGCGRRRCFTYPLLLEEHNWSKWIFSIGDRRCLVRSIAQSLQDVMRGCGCVGGVVRCLWWHQVELSHSCCVNVSLAALRKYLHQTVCDTLW